ncbi:Histone H4,2 [Stemphylium lycopersici]|nr:Histone H4,2 [Stemphylium lycopersici]
MSPSKLGVFANLALAASAVLIPSTLTAEDFGDNHALETLVINPSQRSVALECPECAFATLEGESLKWKADAGNTFRLDFDVGSAQDTLNLDKTQIYPPSFGSSFQPYHVTQVDPSSDDGLRLRVTSFEFQYNGAETISEEGTELLPMTFKITSVEGMPVNPPSLQINVLKDSEGRLMIASFNEAEASKNRPSEKECNEWPLYCKWKTIMADRMEQIKHMGRPRPGCHKRPHNPMEHDTNVGKPPHRFRPGKPHPHHGPHHMGHHHHRHHHFSMFVRRAFFTIFVPILIGIFAGTLTYLVGMALGCLIAITVAKFRGQRYQPIALDEEDIEEAEEHGEKEEYAELPAYDAPPVYEEATDKPTAETK